MQIALERLEGHKMEKVSSIMKKAISNLVMASSLLQKGERAKAWTLLTGAKSLLEKLPNTMETKALMSTIIGTMGVVFYESGKYSQAHRIFLKALQLQVMLTTQNPKNITYQSWVATTKTNLGNLLSRMGRPDEAKKYYDGALKVYEELLKSDPKNITYQSWVVTTKTNLGALLSDMGRFDEAKKHYDGALKTREKLLKSAPKNITYQSWVVTTKTNLGNLLSRMGRFDEAKKHYDGALKTREKLLKSAPKNITYQSWVATTKNNLGNLLSDMGRPDEAKKHYDGALKIHEELLKSNPKNITYQSCIAGTKNNLGNLLSYMRRPDEAKKHYDGALKVYEELLESDPKNITYQSDVAMTKNNLGTLLSDMGRPDEAKKYYDGALKVYEELLESDPKNITYQSDVAMIRTNLGALLSAMGRPDEAKKHYDGALKINEELLKSDPKNITYQSWAAKTKNNLGALLSAMGRTDEAEKAFKKSFELGGNEMKAFSRANLGFSLLGANLRLDEAKKCFQEAGNYFEKLGMDTEIPKMQAFVRWAEAREAWNDKNWPILEGALEEAAKLFGDAGSVETQNFLLSLLEFSKVDMGLEKAISQRDIDLALATLSASLGRGTKIVLKITMEPEKSIAFARISSYNILKSVIDLFLSVDVTTNLKTVRNTLLELGLPLERIRDLFLKSKFEPGLSFINKMLRFKTDSQKFIRKLYRKDPARRKDLIREFIKKGWSNFSDAIRNIDGIASESIQPIVTKRSIYVKLGEMEKKLDALPRIEKSVKEIGTVVSRTELELLNWFKKFEDKIDNIIVEKAKFVEGGLELGFRLIGPIPIPEGRIVCRLDLGGISYRDLSKVKRWFDKHFNFLSISKRRKIIDKIVKKLKSVRRKRGPNH